MVINVNMVKGHDCSESDVLTYTLVKDYIFGGSVIYLYDHTLVRLYEGLFQHKLFFSLIITPYHLYENNNRCTSVGILLPYNT